MPAPLRRLAVLLALAIAACDEPESQSYALNETGSSRHILSCDTVVGTVTTPLTYTVTRSVDPVAPGGVVTYEIVAPLPQIDTPVTATFVASDVTFAIPEGLTLVAAEADPTSSADFTSASAQVIGDFVTLHLTGSFPLDESARPVPLLRVTALVTAAPGATITWRTPASVVGTATVDILGEQVTRCHFEKPGAIAVSHVE